MADLKLLDRVFYLIMQRFTDTGQAPHYTELAKELGLSMEQGRELLHELMEAPRPAYAGERYPAWLYPGTDYIASFAPFNNLPTQYRITIDGQQKWFAQWGFEALAVRWLFPGKTVRVDALCLDCGEPMVVEMRDEGVLLVQPETVVGYASRGFGIGGSPEGRAYRWAGMNLFRSEEHARNWSQFNPAHEVNLRPLSYWAERFSAERIKARGRTDYFSWCAENPGVVPPDPSTKKEK